MLHCRLKCLVFVLLLALFVAGCDLLAGDGLVTARVDDVVIRVAIADDEDSRQQGLMGCKGLKPDEGMLLVYPSQKILKLWMLNMHLPLDAGFFDKDGVLIWVVSMEPDGGKKIHTSPRPALYALEMNRGWFERNGIRQGAKLNLSYESEGR